MSQAADLHIEHFRRKLPRARRSIRWDPREKANAQANRARLEGLIVPDSTAFNTTERYAPRPVRPMGVQSFGLGWRLKVYGIAYQGEEPDHELVEAALGAAESVLPRPALNDDRYGLGFLGIHDGRDSNFVFVSWWENENELQHRVFYSATERPQQLRPATRDRRR